MAIERPGFCWKLVRKPAHQHLRASPLDFVRLQLFLRKAFITITPHLHVSTDFTEVRLTRACARSNVRRPRLVRVQFHRATFLFICIQPAFGNARC